MKNLTELITAAREDAVVYTYPICNFGGLMLMPADYDNDPVADNSHVDAYGNDVMYVWSEYGDGIKNPKRCLVKYGIDPDNKIEGMSPYIYYYGQKYWLNNFMRTE